MKILVIPDVHLKPWMFERASELLKYNKADRAVCLMDIADDWRQQFNLDLYINTYDAAIKFAQDFPDTLWCYGNHDICYLWNQRETGYSKIAPYTVCEKLRVLRETLPDEQQLAFIHRIDNVLFMHGGLTDDFVQQYVAEETSSGYDDIDHIIRTINGFGYSEMWNDDSPLWLRPQYSTALLYKPDKYLQIVGHTPVKYIEQTENLISCDVFCFDQSGTPYGEQKYLIIDTETWNWSKL